jgi:nucleoside-diphosphate-sugar epimerase
MLIMIDDIIREDLEKIKAAVRGDDFSGKRVLVTGGAGFIGSWLCDVLVGFGADVVAVDDFSTGRIENVNHLLLNQQLRLVERDICKFGTDEKFDFIFHMAAHASPDEYMAHPIETLQTSALGTQKIAELARKSDATLLFASTSIGEKLTRLVQDRVMMRGNVLLKRF